MRLAMIGTGLMGSPMAIRLLNAGHTVTVWNRSAAKTADAVAAGARAVATPAAAVADADLVLCILENGPVVGEVLFGAHGLAAALPHGVDFVDLTSMAPETAREHAGALARLGVAHLDAPVSGGPVGALEGSLAIMVGGTPAAFERVQPALAAFGRPVHVGPSGAGQLAKLCSQIITGAAMGAVAEAMTLARAGGADPDKVREALRGGFADSRVLQHHGARMTAGDFEPGGHVRTFLKDLGAAMAVSREHELDLPVTSLVHQLFAAMEREGDGELDISAMMRLVARRNPLPA